MVFNNAPTTALGFWHIFALSAAALLTAHLVFTLLLTYYKIQRQRRRHRELLALLASPSADGPRTMVINVESPVAYCLPGGARSVTVLSDGLMAALEPAELRAVLNHENAHLDQRHHLLLWAFAAWRQALPWLPTTRLAQEAVSSLIEMLADDVALKTESKATLIKAIAIVASGSPGLPAARMAFGEPDLSDGEPGQPGATGGADSARTTASRVSRLLSPQPPLPEPLRRGGPGGLPAAAGCSDGPADCPRPVGLSPSPAACTEHCGRHRTGARHRAGGRRRAAHTRGPGRPA